MPGYIGFRPQFNPISLQEYLTVPTMVLGEYAKAEDAYNETANKAEALKALLGERNADNEAGWKIVDNYEKQLGDLANNIAQGIQGPEAYRQAKSAQRYYRENMLPLESGIPAYQEEIKKWNTDPTMIGNKPALESYIKNPLYRAQMMSGNAIQQEAMKAAAIASSRRKQETADKLIRNGQNYSYYDLEGFNPEEQQAYMLNSELVPELKQLEDSITDKYKQQGYNDADARRYAKLGIIEGITYDRKRHDADNKNYETPAQRAARLAAETPDTPVSDSEYGTALRPASFGRKDLKGNEGNFAIVNSDGSISAKKGDELLDAFGVPKTEKIYSFTDSAGIKHYTNRKLSQEERINRLFASDGRLRKEYSKYTQLSDFGLDLEQNFNSPDVDRVVTEGSITRPTQRIETIKGNTNKERFKNLQNALENTYKTSPEGISNSYYTIIPTNFDPEDIKDVIGKTQYNDWEVFQGQTVDKEGNLNPIRGKKISKRDVISSFNAAQAAGNNPTMDFIPGSNFAVVDLNDGEHVFMTAMDRLDPNFSHKYTYTHEELKKRDEEIEEVKESLEKAEYNYSKNPTNTNRLKYLKAKRIHDSLVWEKEHIGDVYMQGFTKSRIDKTSSRNVNTKEESEKRQKVFNAVTQ